MPAKLSLPRICVALGFRQPEELHQHAARLLDNGESFLEVRLDYLPDPAAGIAVIHELTERNPGVRVLATCRREPNHGFFRGPVEQQVAILGDAIRAGAQCVDLEIESAEVDPAGAAVLRRTARLIVSYHNFESTPAMPQVLRRVSKIPADVYKIVTTARKHSDNLRVLALLKEKAAVPLVVMAMGEIGFPSRVLSPARSGLYTYAAPDSHEGTAPGQVTSHQLRNLYRLEKLTRGAKVYGVIADPVRHSISPQVHNRAFQSKRLDAVYLPLLVPAPQLRDFVQFARELPLAGFSVTTPHKQRILRYLDYVEPMARRLGAVNTVWRKAGKWRGANTDAAAVTGPLSRRLTLAKARILVAGTGGAARSAAAALVECGAQVSLTGRSAEHVAQLVRASGATPLSRQDAEAGSFDAVIHATTVGMFPHGDGCFFERRIPADLVFDMVYNPLETALLRRAREEGKTIITGLEMFIEQAVQQFEIWTGDSAPRPAMEKAALEALGA
ncbi:MAG: shikimate dehydrogenase [Bryobacterales bacterium]|nr:shikimate dehydrogenase [Bryobacterales bacterium]